MTSSISKRSVLIDFATCTNYKIKCGIMLSKIGKPSFCNSQLCNSPYLPCYNHIFMSHHAKASFTVK